MSVSETEATQSKLIDKLERENKSLREALETIRANHICGPAIESIIHEALKAKPPRSSNEAGS